MLGLPASALQQDLRQQSQRVLGKKLESLRISVCNQPAEVSGRGCSAEGSRSLDKFKRSWVAFGGCDFRQVSPNPNPGRLCLARAQVSKHYSLSSYQFYSRARDDNFLTVSSIYPDNVLPNPILFIRAPILPSDLGIHNAKP